MKNYLKTVADNFSTFLNNDNVEPIVKYGIAPPTYMNTDPRFDKRPENQSTPASNRNSSMAPNPQSGRILNPKRSDQKTDQQKYAEFIEGNPPASGVSGDISSGIDTGFYRQDPRVKDVDNSGKTDYQTNPAKGDPDNVRSAQFGYPYVEQTGFESIIDVQAGPYDRDPTEVNTPVVHGNLKTFQGSADQFSLAPMEYVGGSNYAPRQSQYYVKRNPENESAHPDQMWIQPHPNAMAHTIGHDHPYDHDHTYPSDVELSRSIGDRGIRI